MSGQASYRDHVGFVSAGNDAMSYTTIQNYQLAGTNNVPQSSLLLMTVAPSSTKYFAPTAAFQQRTDNYRIPPATQTAVSLTQDYNDYPGGPDASSTSTNTAPLSTSARHSPYATYGTQAYQLGRR
jgi:hypothetical protein